MKSVDHKISVEVFDYAKLPPLPIRINNKIYDMVDEMNEIIDEFRTAHEYKLNDQETLP